MRALPDRVPELFGRLAGLGQELSAHLDGLDEPALEAIAAFLDHAAAAAARATDR